MRSRSNSDADAEQPRPPSPPARRASWSVNPGALRMWSTDLLCHGVLHGRRRSRSGSSRPPRRGAAALPTQQACRRHPGTVGFFFSFTPVSMLRGNAQAIVRARRVGRQVAPAVRRADLQPREAVERALEQRGARERWSYRGGCRSCSRASRCPSAAGEVGVLCGWMKIRTPKLFRLGPERVEHRVGEFLAGNALAPPRRRAARAASPRPRTGHRPPGRGIAAPPTKSDETIGIVLRRIGNLLVLNADYLGVVTRSAFCGITAD